MRTDSGGRVRYFIVMEPTASARSRESMPLTERLARADQVVAVIQKRVERTSLRVAETLTVLRISEATLRSQRMGFE